MFPRGSMATRRRTRPARVALVTGAARRIGREIALALARDGWDPPVPRAARRIGREIGLALARDGWDIAVHYATSRDDGLETVRELEAIGRRAIAGNRDLNV